MSLVTRARPLVGAVGLALIALTFAPTAAQADGPGSGTPHVVSVGDSYISGEAGRWAGSSNDSSARADRLGSTAYFDNAANNAEQIDRCHRSKSAEIYLGGGVTGLNLACSGAKTATSDGSNFKPGLDFFDNGAGKLGQAKMLQQFAATHNVKMVAVSIGGNDFNFADIVQSCVVDFLGSPSWWKDYCYDDNSVTANFTSSNVAAVKTKIANAYTNIRTAMRNAGYADSSWTLLVQNYPSPHPQRLGLPLQPERLHPAEHGWLRILGRRRQLGQRHRTADDQQRRDRRDQPGRHHQRQDAQPLVDLQRSATVREHRRSVRRGRTGQLDRSPPRSTGPSGSTRSAPSPPAGSSPYYIQESLHPNYWGQLATRSCVRQAYNAGVPKSGSCARTGTGLSVARRAQDDAAVVITTSM